MCQDFILNYLKDKSQSVVSGSFSSFYKLVTSGVPQGSILSPNLFVLFLNYITDKIDDTTNILIHADDTKICCEIKCDNDHDVLRREIDSLVDWALQNCIQFHPSKCKVSISHGEQVKNASFEHLALCIARRGAGGTSSLNPLYSFIIP